MGLDAEVANADFTFGTPTNLGPTVNSSSADAVPTISGDGLELYFTSDRSGGQGGSDIWVSKRATTEDEWGQPVNLGPTVNSSYSENAPSISPDGLALYFGDWPSPRPGGVGGVDIWVATRPTTEDDWGEPVNLGPTVNSERMDGIPSISGDGLELYFTTDRPGGEGGHDVWVARRPTTSDPWSTPVNLGPPVNTSSGDCCPSISANGRTLFFGSTRGGSAGYDLWVTTRANVSDPWGQTVNLGPTANSSSFDDGPSISADGSTLFFMSNRPGGVGSYDLWQVSISPVVDFNGNGKVDNADICTMADYWQTDEPACDIGPTPFGDGIVDAQDMLVLTEYMTKEKVDVEADIAAINELWNQYGIATTSGDLELYVSLWDDSGISMGPDSPATIGIEQIRASMEGFFAVFNLEGIPIVVEEAEVAGDWAFTRVAFRISVTPKGEPEASPRSGKALSILKRQADGSWKLYIDCWRFDAPPPVE